MTGVWRASSGSALLAIAMSAAICGPGLEAHAQGPAAPPSLDAAPVQQGGGAGQQSDGPGGPPSQGPPPFAHDHGRDRHHDGPSPGAPQNSMRGGLQLGPPGRWWDDPDFVATLRLRPEQQTRMDAIFAQNKSTLQADYEALRDEERQLQPLTRGVSIDEHTLFAHIDRLSQARAELEKANVHMLLLLRHELTPDQVNLLDEHRPPPFR